MINKIILCLLIVCLTSDIVISRNGSRSSGRSRSSGSHSRGRSSSHSSYKPPSSSFGHKYPSSSGLPKSGSMTHNYPSSSSGLSGSSWSGHSALGSGSNKPSYPSSSSGLSGSGGNKAHYPSASSGLSGFGFSKPSQSFSSHFSGSGSLQPSYSSSSSGLSGSGGSKPLYPSSSSGLSGSDRNKPSPSLSTGFTGSGAIKPNYPSSSSGLSGFGDSKPLNYPTSGFSGINWNKPSPTLSPGFTGSGSMQPKNPSSSSGVFGFAWNKSREPGSKKVNYPPSSGKSGNENHMYPTSSNNFYNKPYDTTFHRSNGSQHSGSGTHSYGHSGNTHVNYAIPQNYHTFPQYVYVSQYRDSGSRYGDLLTGLALYNMGRSHSHHYHDHYFYDDYYRTRHISQNGNGYTYRNSERPKDEASCTLTIKETDRQELLKIPCEIVSTFVEDGKRTNYTHTQTNITTCITNLTTIDNAVNQKDKNNSLPIFTNTPTLMPILLKNSTTKTYNNTQNFTSVDNLSVVPVTIENSERHSINSSLAQGNLNKQSNFSQNTNKFENISDNFNVKTTANGSETLKNETTKVIINATNRPLENINNFDNTKAINSTHNSVTNSVTTCTTVSNTTDPIKIKGPPVNAKKTECTVNIMTKEYSITNAVDCSVILKYSKIPEKQTPAKVESSFLSSKAKIKSCLENPPWWLSLFIAVKHTLRSIY